MKIAYQELSKDKIISYLNQSSENITKINVNNKEVNSFSVNKKSDFDKANEEKCQNICKYSYRDAMKIIYSEVDPDIREKMLEAFIKYENSKKTKT